jgi:hypothetical protein
MDIPLRKKVRPQAFLIAPKSAYHITPELRSSSIASCIGFSLNLACGAAFRHAPTIGYPEMVRIESRRSDRQKGQTLDFFTVGHINTYPAASHEAITASDGGCWHKIAITRID